MLPAKATTTTTTMMATRAPREMVMPPEEVPLAPAREPSSGVPWPATSSSVGVRGKGELSV